MLLLAVLRRARSVFLLTAGNEGNGTNAVGDSIPYPPQLLRTALCTYKDGALLGSCSVYHHS